MTIATYNPQSAEDTGVLCRLNINPLTPELNASCSGCLLEFFMGFLNFNACS